MDKNPYFINILSHGKKKVRHTRFSTVFLLPIIQQSSINITVQQFFARRHQRRGEISQAHQRLPQNTAGDFLH